MFKGALPGFRDFYPQEFAERAHIMATWRDVARRYAFVEYDGPPLEPLELYTRKSGDEIVGQLYNFLDKGQREVALRPEMTPTVARMVAARANALRKPVRWFSMPQLFRYERQQKGRLREHYQLNVDIFGSAEVAADAELVACAVDIMRAFGLTSDDVVVRPGRFGHGCIGRHRQAGASAGAGVGGEARRAWRAGRRRGADRDDRRRALRRGRKPARDERRRSDGRGVRGLPPLRADAAR